MFLDKKVATLLGKMKILDYGKYKRLEMMFEVADLINRGEKTEYVFAITAKKYGLTASYVSKLYYAVRENLEDYRELVSRRDFDVISDIPKEVRLLNVIYQSVPYIVFHEGYGKRINTYWINLGTRTLEGREHTNKLNTKLREYYGNRVEEKPERTLPPNGENPRSAITKVRRRRRFSGKYPYISQQREAAKSKRKRQHT